MGAEQPLPNEASVEWKVVLPLLHRLGYDLDDIHPQFKVELWKGRRGRKPAADVAVFSGRPHDRHTSLIAVEAKKPDEPLWDAKEQAESYRIGIRAPFTLIIDGDSLELWQFQPTQESTNVLAFRLADLEANFGMLHAILSKPAAIAYCRSLDLPNAANRAADWSSYAATELKRWSDAGPHIKRTLFDTATSADIGSGALLDDYLSGAVITDASGLGKTSLSIALLMQALLRQPASPPAVYVPVTDIPAGQSIMAFCAARLDAHKPGTTVHRLHEIMRDAGLLLLVDAFDRLPAAMQEAFAAELRNLKRDFPKLQTFLFSRAGARPPIALPTLVLKPLTSVEQFDLVKITHGQDAMLGWHHAPGRLRELCSVPLLLKLANDYKARHRQFPPSLLDLFENWLAVTVDPDGRSASRRIVRERALRKIAAARTSRPVSPALAFDILSRHGGDAALLDELIQSDAIRVDGQTVNFAHEALADYLLALDITDQMPEDAIARLGEVQLESGSYFPVLLMNASGSVDFQAQLWRRLEQCDLQTYLAVLRYKGPIVTGTIDPVSFATEYLAELLDGIEAPLRSFFPEIAGLAREHLADEDCDALRIVGNASTTSVHYSLAAMSPDSARVAIGFDKQASCHHVVNLDLSRLRADSGRLIGMRRVREAVDILLASRAMHAGPAMASERVLGRLRYLARAYDFVLASDATLDAAISELEQLRGEYADCPPGRSEKRFRADDVLDDLAILQRASQLMPRPWWRPDVVDAEPDWSDAAAKRYALNAHFQRAQAVYAEIVTRNFASIATSLNFYSMLPVRWTISAPAHPDYREAWYTFTYMPVVDWSLAGATLSTVEPTETAAHLRAHYDAVVAELSRLRRLRANPSVGWHRSALPRFDGEDHLGNYDGETSALRTAFKWLEDDLKRLFQDLP